MSTIENPMGQGGTSRKVDFEPVNPMTPLEAAALEINSELPYGEPYGVTRAQARMVSVAMARAVLTAAIDEMTDKDWDGIITITELDASDEQLRAALKKAMGL